MFLKDAIISIHNNINYIDYKSYKSSKFFVFITLFLFLMTLGCASNKITDTQVRDAIKRNPQIIYDVIEDNPLAFLTVINRAAQKAQQEQYQAQLLKSQEDQAADMKNPRKPALSSDRRLTGNEKAPIVIVEYADFQCPACRVGHGQLAKIKEKYGEKVQFYFKNMPLDFHPMAYPAAQHFEALRLQSPTKALKFYNKVFEQQEQLKTIGFLKELARTLGADMKRLEKDLDSAQVNQIIEEDISEFKKFGFTGTPVTIVNGVALPGAQPVDAIEAVIQKTLK